MESIGSDVGEIINEARKRSVSSASQGDIPGAESEGRVPGRVLYPACGGFAQAPGCPSRLEGFRPAQSTSPEWTSKYEWIKGNVSTGCIYGISGQRGCGKSQLGVCLIGYTITKLQKVARYTKTYDVFLRIREAMKTDGDSERMAIEEYVKPFLVVVDAYEVRSDSDFENRMIDHIIDKRYDAMKSTIIISNDAQDAFIRHLGPSIVDRMAETGGIITLTNKSFRR